MITLRCLASSAAAAATLIVSATTAHAQSPDAPPSLGMVQLGSDAATPAPAIALQTLTLPSIGLRVRVPLEGGTWLARSIARSGPDAQPSDQLAHSTGTTVDSVFGLTVYAQARCALIVERMRPRALDAVTRAMPNAPRMHPTLLALPNGMTLGCMDTTRGALVVYILVPPTDDAGEMRRRATISGHVLAALHVATEPGAGNAVVEREPEDVAAAPPPSVIVPPRRGPSGK